MKNILTLILCFSLVTACKDNSPHANVLIYEGTKYPLSEGFSENTEIISGKGETFYHWDIVLASEGIGYDGFFFGDGELIHFELVAMNDNNPSLPPGEYRFPKDGDYYMTGGDLFIESDLPISSKGITYSSFKNAEVSIAKNGNTYTIEFKGTLPDDTSVEGSFQGILPQPGI